MTLTLWPWVNSRIQQVVIGLWVIGALFAFYSQGLPNLWGNLGRIKRNQALMVATIDPINAYNHTLSQAARLFERSNKFDPCNPLGFFGPSVMVCAEVEQWQEMPRTETNGAIQPIYLAPSDLADIKYGQTLSLILPTQEFSDLDSLTLLTYTGHSTRIRQGELIAYAIVITREREAYLLPLRAGLETAEGSYDSPDVPPQHVKPTISYLRSGGGTAYPVQLHFERPISPVAITIVFTYAPHWHIEPVLKIWGISVDPVGTSALLLN